MVADGLQVLVKIVGEALGLFVSLAEFLEGVLEGEQRGIVAAAAHGAAQVAEIRDAIEHVGLHVLDQIAATLLGVRQELPQGHALDGLIVDHERSPKAGNQSAEFAGSPAPSLGNPPSLEYGLDVLPRRATPGGTGKVFRVCVACRLSRMRA